jgi:hypothetical protein
MTTRKDKQFDITIIILLVLTFIGWVAFFLRPMLEAICRILGDDHMDDIRAKWNEVVAGIEKADAKMMGEVLTLRKHFKMEEK